MLRTFSTTSRLAMARRAHKHGFHSTALWASHQPNAPLDLDPSFRALLNDVDLSLLRHKTRHVAGEESLLPEAPRELEVFANDSPAQDGYLTSAELDSQDEVLGSKEGRKSPAALFGSQRIGAVILPLELQSTITRLIAGSDKSMLHVDAKRLFLSDEPNETEAHWDSTYDTRYKSRQAAVRHGARDGTAFASVALPAHYSAVYAVLDHVKQRMGPSWTVEHVIDWNAGTGSALWASLYSFQNPQLPIDGGDLLDDPQIANTSIASYLAVDKRDGLVNIGKKLLEGVAVGQTNISWRRSYHGGDKPERSDNGEVLAISAFMLSSLPTPIARKALVKDMWESGAETIILVDHNTNTGFDSISAAREFLLKQGRKELEGLEAADQAGMGCHVIAPCPHDSVCPLASSKLVCGFSQRLQRPDFVRKTKHSGVGHEDTGYSYVVIRRGPRPARAETKVGRVGEVGRREEAKLAVAQAPITELVLDGPYLAEHRMEDEVDEESAIITSSELQLSPEELDTALRLEAYDWPRLVFPPLKKPGHIILDGCTQEGKIMRMTIPKSQGKQPFYDARKSSWGDIFPHDPKNRPQERSLPRQVKRSKGTTDMDRKKSPEQLTMVQSVKEMEKEKGRVKKERKFARMQRSGL